MSQSYPREYDNLSLLLAPFTGILKDFDSYFSQNSPTRSWEDDNEYYFECDLPGFKQSDIEVKLDNRHMSIFAQIKNGNNSRISRYRHIFPPNIDLDNIIAKLENGVLQLKSPKLSLSNSRRINIS